MMVFFAKNLSCFYPYLMHLFCYHLHDCLCLLLQRIKATLILAAILGEVGDWVTSSDFICRHKQALLRRNPSGLLHEVPFGEIDWETRLALRVNGK